MPCSGTMPRPIRSRPAQRLTSRRRRTTPSAASRATRSQRPTITSSRSTGTAERSVTVGKQCRDGMGLFQPAALTEDGGTKQAGDVAVKSPHESHPPFPLRDYSVAVQSAVSWLGDRYLLATPIPARSHERPATSLVGGSKPLARSSLARRVTARSSLSEQHARSHHHHAYTPSSSRRISSLGMSNGFPKTESSGSAAAELA